MGWNHQPVIFKDSATLSTFLYRKCSKTTIPYPLCHCWIAPIFWQSFFFFRGASCTDHDQLVCLQPRVLALGPRHIHIGADVLSGWGVEGFRWRSESSFSLIFEVSLMPVWRNSQNNSWTPKKCWKRKVSPGCFKVCFGLKAFMFFFAPPKKNRKLHLMGSEASQRPTMS